jgi:RNA polymerase sigma-70 factor (ECF subfamily)
MPTDVTVEALLREARWAQRLATALVGAEHGPDLAQDGFIAALRSRPDTERPLRPWLARVVRNLARNRKRDDQRREARHAAAAADTAARPATPEDLLERMELQRTLAAMVAGLPEPYRQTILLHYYEDLSSDEIGSRLGVPAGTVRWRLKVAVDRLRQQLDETFGDRRRWRLLMAPLVPEIASSAGRGVVAVWLTAVGLLAVMAVVVSTQRGAGGRAVVGSSQNPPTPRRAANHALSLPAAIATPCPEADELRREIAVRQREWEEREPANAIFERSSANPIAHERFSALARRAFSCSHAVECRGIVCRVTLLVPEGGLAALQRCIPHEEGTASGIPSQYLHDRGVVWTAGRETRDLVSGDKLQQLGLFFRLATPQAYPAQTEAPPRRPPLASGRHRRRSPPPADRSLDCRAEISRLGDVLAALELRTDEVVRPHEVFASSDPNPDLAPEVGRELAGILGLPPQSFPFDVECRGPVCSATPKNEKDPAMASWPDWWKILQRRRQSALFAVIDTPPVLGTIHVRVRTPEDRAKADPSEVVRGFLRAVASADVFARCKSAHTGWGTLVVRVTVPKGTGQLTIETEGKGARTPLGACIVDDLAAIASTTEVPETRASLVWTFSPFLPLAPALDERPGPWR